MEFKINTKIIIKIVIISGAYTKTITQIHLFTYVFKTP